MSGYPHKLLWKCMVLSFFGIANDGKAPPDASC